MKDPACGRTKYWIKETQTDPGCPTEAGGELLDRLEELKEVVEDVKRALTSIINAGLDREYVLKHHLTYKGALGNIKSELEWKIVSIECELEGE